MSITVFPPVSSSGKVFTRLATVTSSGTWTHPDGASTGSPKEVFVVAIGGGGGGAGGGARALGGAGNSGGVSGSGGGGSGFVAYGETLVFAPVSVSIGAGGTGGAGAGSNQPNNTFKAGDGGVTSFGTLGGDTTSKFFIRAMGGLGPFSAPSITQANQTVSGGAGQSSGGIGYSIESFATIAGGVGGSDFGKSSMPIGSGGSGGGSGGVWTFNFNAVQFTGALGGLHSTGNGGNGANGRHVNTATVGEQGNAGGNATGRGAGGGAGGGIMNWASAATVGGVGGAGSAGVIYIFH
jgi:hypothetical protein